MDSRHIEVLVALDRLNKGTMEYQEATEIVDKAIEAAVLGERERCIAVACEFDRKPIPTRPFPGWRWILNNYPERA